MDALIFCEQVNAAFDNYDVRCFGGEAAHHRRSRYAIETDCVRFATDVANRKMAFHQDAANVCLAGLLNQPCHRWGAGAGLPSCRQMMLGAVPEDGACLDRECQPGLLCVMLSECDFRCKRIEIVAADGDCSGETAFCDEGLHCDSGRCVPLVAEGQPCRSRLECFDPLFCNDSNRCEQPRGEHAACDSDSECHPTLHCAKTPWESGTCEQLRKMGDVCAPGRFQCSDRAYCAEDSRVCTPDPGPGERCGRLGEYASCQDSYCTDSNLGTCVTRKLSGRCDDSSECKFRCHDGQCTSSWANPACEG